MATGRGQFLLTLMQGLERIQPGRHGENARGSRKKKPARNNSSRRCRGECTKPPSPVHQSACCPTLSWCPPAHLRGVNYFESLPPEVILKIFSFLDASSLFSVGFVNCQFQQLANDSAIWYELYSNEMGSRKQSPRPCWTPNPADTEAQDVPAAAWKKLLFGKMGCQKDAAWRRELRHVNLHTGMPEQTKQVLRGLCVVWEITLTLKQGKQIVYKHSQALFFDSSVTVCWNSGVWPNIHNVYSMQLHGVLGLPTTRLTKPRWRSLLSKTVVRGKKWWNIGTDSLAMLIKFDEGITVGVWRGTRNIAFIMATLHFHRLVERSVLGSLFCPYRPGELSPLHCDVPPGASVHGYTLFMLLHNSVRRIMQCRYSPVLCTREKLCGEFVRLRPVHSGTPQKATPISGKISFPWKSGELQGDIKDCCMITVSVLDEAQRPVWCISSSASLLPGPSSEACETYDSEQSTLRFHDDIGKLRMTLLWMQDLQLYFLIDLNVRIRVEKVDRRSRSGANPTRR